MTYSHMDESTLPLALRCFTSEFGKGSGGAIALLSSAKGVRYESDVVIIDVKILSIGRPTCNLTESRLKVISKYSFFYSIA